MDKINNKTLEERFWEKVNIGGKDDCWNWIATINYKGYGEFYSKIRGGKHTHSHQVAWMLFSEKDIPEGMCVCHVCDNPSCCNPSHLFLGTNQENTDDKMKKGRWKSRFLFGEEHPQHGELSKHNKLSEDNVREIRSMWASKEFTLRDIAKKFGVTHGVINNINHGRKWAWLK